MEPMKPGKTYSQDESNKIMVETWIAKEHLVRQMLEKQSNLLQLKHLPIGIYANLANKKFGR